ncbi:MAG: hypothetical protein Q9168_003428 [Polycauliona sp. 1 TL-2023]
MKGSLLDQSLTTLAKSTSHPPGSASPEISLIPLHLKALLLSYIAAYSQTGFTIAELKSLLTEGDHTESTSDRILTSIQHLDLSHSIANCIYFDELTSCITFSSLTHLCLANPGPQISWSSFLAFAETQIHLTHLSLAYWPKVAAGTSPERENSDANPLDATMRSMGYLSRTLTKLQYLDLEGCSSWISILNSDPDDGGIDWFHGWKDVQTLNLSQGPMPIGVSMEGGLATENWLQGEVEARRIGDVIDHKRKELGDPDVPPLQLEHGWSPDNFMIKFLVDKAYERCRLENPSRENGTEAPDYVYRDVPT